MEVKRNILVALRGPFIDTTEFHKSATEDFIKWIIQDPRVVEIMDYDTNEIIYKA